MGGSLAIGNIIRYIKYYYIRHRISLREHTTPISWYAAWEQRKANSIYMDGVVPPVIAWLR